MPTVTVEDMIVEGFCTAEWALRAGYRWDALVVGGDAFHKRQAWLTEITRVGTQVPSGPVHSTTRR